MNGTTLRRGAIHRARWTGLRRGGFPTLPVLLGFLFLSLFLLPMKHAQANPSATISKACFSERCYRVSVADTPETRAQGLMFRDGLAADEGMLFVFPEETQESFWMKNMKFTIDILWMDQSGVIVHVEHHVPPCTVEPCQVYTPETKALYVLEIPSGDADRYHLAAPLKAQFSR